MSRDTRPITILVAEDDAEDRMLIGEAFAEARLNNDVRFVHDGEELMDYLYGRGEYSPPANALRPGVIMLDLNMPRKSGREALEEIRGEPRLSSIPVIVMTTSNAEIDINGTYALGANSYVRKPVSFEALVDLAKTLGRYWFEIVELPR
jgi:CheY-like chemotaxis protein